MAECRAYDVAIKSRPDVRRTRELSLDGDCSSARYAQHAQGDCLICPFISGMALGPLVTTPEYMQEPLVSEL